ncbi:hypothetical protein ACSHWG_05305 [Leucobacter sp. Z1108]|uniref:hypothetical protein n=1 Tax=Leucobacter sp. Z1108 TaxID=3439066 RepID=UPI003F3D220A
MQRHTTDSEGRHGAVIEVRGLSKGYGDRQVLDGVDLAIAPGRNLCSAGPERSRQEHRNRDP